MSNYNLYKDRPFDKKWYKFYLRNESLKKLLYDGLYKEDKSIEGYHNSKFYKAAESVSYSEYLVESLDKNIQYSDYISESIDKSISYSDYLAQNLNTLITYNQA